jgi:GH15 family glucan-1,4-alpha-glucosidase
MAEQQFSPVEDYGLIGDMHTCALVSKQGSIDFMCWPKFDSPSTFCRLLDGTHGGHWSVKPIGDGKSMNKQQYLPASNILQTRWIHEDGVVTVNDFFVVTNKEDGSPGHKRNRSSILARRLECIRGKMKLEICICPRPDYGRQDDKAVISKDQDAWRVDFSASHLTLSIFPVGGLEVVLKNGVGVRCEVDLQDGNEIFFALYEQKPQTKLVPSIARLRELENNTNFFWIRWARRMHYVGRYRLIVERSLLILKLLTYQPTGSIVASPTFSLPEAIGGARNWDYRYSWIRDSSFTVYVFLKMGYGEEAEAYINFIFARIADWQNSGADKMLPLMFSIDGNPDLPEQELDHLGGYRNTKPVRIGNAAAHHTQLDIYGELMDSIYLYNKHGKPITYDQWLSIRAMIGYVCTIWEEPDMSIWEVRGRKENFVYSKIMLWVAFDRALRLAEKRCFPCPNRLEWVQHRDTLYDQVMKHGYNETMGSFIQSYETRNAIDSAVLIAPLVFFIAPNDPRFLGTLDRILKSPEKGGLSSAGMVFRYDNLVSDDGKYSSLYSRQLSPISRPIVNLHWKITLPRRRRPRRHILHVYLLAHRSPHPSRHLRRQLSPPCRHPLREHAQLRQPSRHVLRGNRHQWRAVGQYPAGFQSSRLGQCGHQPRSWDCAQFVECRRDGVIKEHCFGDEASWAM